MLKTNQHKAIPGTIRRTATHGMMPGTIHKTGYRAIRVIHRIIHRMAHGAATAHGAAIPGAIGLIYGFVFASIFFLSINACAEVLPSWHNTETKTRIINFVKNSTTKNNADYVAPGNRIAVFDNDGTLWSEQPVYFQLQFVIDRIKAMAPQHPEWQKQQPYQAILKNDWDALKKLDHQQIITLLMVTHAHMSPDAFSRIVKKWLASAKHPRFNKKYTELVYQPMLDLLKFLKQKGYKIYIVSGGGVDFIRAFSEQIYHIPPEQVIGSRIKMKFVHKGNQYYLKRMPSIDFIDDKEGKPIAIQHIIGKRPVIAVGNSDGDLQMFQWTSSTQNPHLIILIHHTDKKREWAYDRHSHVGRLDKALQAAKKNKWIIVNMQQDWKKIYP